MSARPGTRPPRIAVVGDRIAARNGRAMFYERFFDACTARELPLLVVGDAPPGWRRFTGHTYVEAPRAPLAGIAPDRDGVGPRPFIAFSDPALDPSGQAGLARAVARLARHNASAFAPDAFAALDALSTPSWRAPLALAMDRVLAAAPIEAVLIPTQSFLGVAMADAARARGLRILYMVHSDYPAIFFDRLAAGLPPEALPAALPVRTAMYRRLASQCLHAGATAGFRASAWANHLRCYAPDGDYGELLVPPAVDADVFFPAPGDGAPRRPLRLLVVGRLEFDKGIGLLPAIDAALDRAPVRWTIVGEGPQRAWLEARLPAARFLGHLPQAGLAEAYRDADVLVAPSRIETFGNMAIEAMASGVPVVCSNVGGWVSYVLHGETGLLCDDDPGAFARAIERVRDDLALRDRLRERGRRFAERCPWQGVWRVLIDHLSGR